MKELTIVQEALIRMMNLRGVSSNSIIPVMIALKEETQQRQMMDYLIANKKAGEQEVLKKLEEIIAQDYQ